MFVNFIFSHRSVRERQLAYQERMGAIHWYCYIGLLIQWCHRVKIEEKYICSYCHCNCSFVMLDSIDRICQARRSVDIYIYVFTTRMFNLQYVSIVHLSARISYYIVQLSAWKVPPIANWALKIVPQFAIGGTIEKCLQLQMVALLKSAIWGTFRKIIT